MERVLVAFLTADSVPAYAKKASSVQCLLAGYLAFPFSKQ